MQNYGYRQGAMENAPEKENTTFPRLYAGAPQQVRRQLLVRQQAIRSIAALDAAIHSIEDG